jgi:succinyl-CoA synthetase beta subunit
MKLLECKVKEIFNKYGIPTPNGVVVSSVNDLASIAKNNIPFPVAIKAQILSGGRGKAGGIKFANNPEEAMQKTRKIIGMDINKLKVKQVLIENKLNISRELYLSIVIDRSTRTPILLASAEGGVDIESVEEKKIFRNSINPFVGLRPFILRNLSKKLNLNKQEQSQITNIASRMYEIFVKEDAELVEINPLVVTTNGDMIAADGKMIIDDDAVCRHPEYRSIELDLTPLEKMAKEKGIAFVQLDGNIGVIANGAGLTMATLDHLTLHGGSAGVFLDLGGTDDPEKVKEALRLMKMANPTVVLINIFGGITRCDTVATGIKSVLESEGMNVPIVVRIKGSRENEAKTILKDAGLFAATTLEEAVKKTVELSK